ncbi:MAG: hypothetical protein AAGK21_11720 [Bacteroidota bacterium]
MSCADVQFANDRARLADDIDEPPVPVGGLDAIQARVRIPRERMRTATPGGRYAIVRAVVDTTGAVRCSDVLSSGTRAQGEAAREAIHESTFTPGRHEGILTATVLDLRLDVRGQGVPVVVPGDQIGM